MTCGSDSWVSFVSINFQPCLSSTTHACKVQSNSGCWQSKKLQVRGRFFKKLYRDKRWSFLGGRKQIQWLQLVGIQRYFAYFFAWGLLVQKCVQMMPCRIGTNDVWTWNVVLAVKQIKGSLSRALWRKILGKSWHFMLCQMHFLIIVVGSTQVGFTPCSSETPGG